jgi:UDP-N-acetylmuramate--alanine ligase
MEVDLVVDKNRVAAALKEKLKPGEIALTLGAGDIYKVGDALVEALQQKKGVLE